MHTQPPRPLLLGLASCLGVALALFGCQTTQEQPQTTASKPQSGHTWYRDQHIAFQHDEDLHVEVVQYGQETLWVLRDYSKSDNFRAFTLTVRISPVTAPAPLAQRARLALDDLSSGVAQDAKVLSQQPETWHDEPALRLRATYRYVGGREVYTDHKGKTRSTADHPLEMHWTSLLGHTHNHEVQISMDASRDHHDKRAPGLAAVIQTLEIPPQGSTP